MAIPPDFVENQPSGREISAYHWRKTKNQSPHEFGHIGVVKNFIQQLSKTLVKTVLPRIFKTIPVGLTGCFKINGHLYELNAPTQVLRREKRIKFFTYPGSRKHPHLVTGLDFRGFEKGKTKQCSECQMDVESSEKFIDFASSNKMQGMFLVFIVIKRGQCLSNIWSAFLRGLMLIDKRSSEEISCTQLKENNQENRSVIKASNRQGSETRTRGYANKQKLCECLSSMCLEMHFVFLGKKPNNPEASMDVKTPPKTVTITFIHSFKISFMIKSESSPYISQIISYWSYPSEECEVIIADAYILQLNWIPNGKNGANYLDLFGEKEILPNTYINKIIGQKVCHCEVPGTICNNLLTLAYGYEPQNLNESQMISYWGYPSEMHKVITADGYILQVYRIPHGKNNANHLGQRPVVFLQHGLLGSATNWISNLPKNSLGFLLADAGYDVWLGNSRGNTWAQEHLYYSPDSPEFWAFSFDEMAEYDLPSTIDFILRRTGQKKLHYVGHSQGTTIGFIAFSTNPTLAEKIKVFYALAPVATVKYTKSLFNKLALIPHFLFKIIFGDKMFYPHTFLEQFLGVEMCSRETLDVLCKNALFAITGVDNKNFNMSRLDVYIAHNPAGTSVQNTLHWRQAVKSGKFQAFDWGAPYQNLMHYHQPTPPIYNLTAMNVPIAVWSADNDLLADPQDVDLLLSKLSNLIYHKEIPNYNHLDFIWAMDAPQEVYNEIVSLMAEDKK
ncbi:hypothetical protein E5288_WYG008900 [Bos mutus]|uniref:Gastric triacylglycerol lipase n=1 Tax=Bos mutus TaxID=72004 RepID=A0A6B0QW53_9CETA|nr:hypothetical protein [Bos mutus]